MSAETTPAAPRPESITRHRTTIDGRALDYSATAGTVRLHRKDGTPRADMFYVAFTADGVDDKSARPITFAFNGGPGSSSVWLQLGALGPRRVDLPDTVAPPPPPYRLVDNAFGLLDQTDLVFIDPVATGFSKAAKDDDDSFFNIDGDVEAVAEFVWRYLTKNQRWNSPRFLAGESYGTTRAVGLARRLQERGVVLNGLVLLSLALDFQTFLFEVGNELPYVLYLPTYAAVAAYHGRLAEPPEDLWAFLDEVRAFAVDEYAPALLRGSGLDAERRARIVEKLAGYTGLDARTIDRLDLRVEYLRFAKSLLDRPGHTVGRLDARYTGPDLDRDHRQLQRDPSYDAPLGAFTALINDYLRRVLRYAADDDRYTVLSMDVNRAWSWADKGRMGHPSVADDLRRTLVANPHLRVIVLNGIHDLATPFFAAEYTIDHLGLEPEQRANIELTYYEAGHMMYFHPPSLRQMRADLVRFYEKAAPKSGG